MRAIRARATRAPRGVDLRSARAAIRKPRRRWRPRAEGMSVCARVDARVYSRGEGAQHARMKQASAIVVPGSCPRSFGSHRRRPSLLRKTVPCFEGCASRLTPPRLLGLTVSYYCTPPGAVMETTAGSGLDQMSRLCGWNGLSDGAAWKELGSLKTSRNQT